MLPCDIKKDLPTGFIERSTLKVVKLGLKEKPHYQKSKMKLDLCSNYTTSDQSVSTWSKYIIGPVLNSLTIHIS